jgi:VCBS repeat-containing protein
MAKQSTPYTVSSDGTKISGGNGVDVIDVNAIQLTSPNATTISGGNGNDIIKGGSKADTIWGDSLGNSGTTSDNGADTMYGGAGNDKIHGGNGADFLQGDVGADELWGDRGGDTFNYVDVNHSSTASGIDTINDFKASEGDKINLSGLNDELTGGGPSKLTWGSGATAHGVWTNGTQLFADTTGDGVADLIINVNGVTSSSVIGVNLGPIAGSDLNKTATEDQQPTKIDLREGASDPNGDTLTVANFQYKIGAGPAVSGLPQGLSLTGSELTVDTQDDVFDSLAAGETQTIVLTYDVVDQWGAKAAKTATVTITGVNDDPEITSGTQSGSVTEDTKLTATGAVTATDVDNGDVLAYSGDDTGAYGSFELNATTGAWTYTLDTDAHQDLAEGESYDETFTVTVTDDTGATATQDVTITVNGSNDDPEITSGAQSDPVTEDTKLTATGAVTATDVDNGAVLAYSGDDTGTYGSFAVNATTGAWTYTLANDAHQALAAGESHDEIFTVTVTDDKGATATQDVTITVTGTNDEPVISSGAQSDSVTEDSKLTATGTVTATDVDNGAVLAYSGDDTGTYGSFAVNATTGAWIYTLANDAHQALAAGESHDEIFTVTVTDDKGATATQDVTITVTGTNDDPVITGGDTATYSIAENTTAVATVASSDIDGGTAVWTILAGGEGSLFNISSEGVVTFNSAPDFEAPTDAAPTNSYQLTVQMSDGFGGLDTQAITVNVTNVVEGPTVIGPFTGGGDPNDFDTSGPATGSSDGTKNADTLVGTSGGETISAQGGDDIVYGRGGNDVINGNNGDDRVYGQDGDDTVKGDNDNDVIYGGSGNDDINGGVGADTIYGGSGADKIDGDIDADTIIGGYGADILLGRGGADTFRFIDIRDTGDTISDFKVSDGDKLDFSLVDPIGPFSLHANTNTIFAFGINFFQDGANTVVWADTDGDVSTVELQVMLTGVTATSLTSGSFVL